MGISENALTPRMTGRLMFNNYVFILLINITTKLEAYWNCPSGGI